MHNQFARLTPVAASLFDADEVLNQTKVTVSRPGFQREIFLSQSVGRAVAKIFDLKSRVCEDELAGQLEIHELAGFYFAISQLVSWRMVQYELWFEEELLATLCPIGSRASRLEIQKQPQDDAIHLAPYTYARRHNNNVQIENARVAFSCILIRTDLLASILTCRKTIPLLDDALLAAGLFTKSHIEENAFWPFHDCLFHSRTRDGFHEAEMGGTYRFIDKCLKPEERVISGNRIQLNSTINHGPWDLFVKRSSIRHHGTNPISKEQLSQFLLVVFDESVKFSAEEGVHRSYPCSGGIRSHRVFVVISQCIGLESGCYEYYIAGRELIRLEGNSSQISSQYRWVMETAKDPQVTIVLASDIALKAWKYESIAYSLILRDIGAVLQSMYLVAGALGLAPCAVGSGRENILEELGCNGFPDLVPVGEFVLGSLPF